MFNLMCFSVINFLGLEVMRFFFFLCLDCSNNDFFIEGLIRQNFFCGINEIFYSFNLFFLNLEYFVVGFIYLEYFVQQMGVVLNLEKGFQINYVMFRYESLFFRLYMYQFLVYQ